MRRKRYQIEFAFLADALTKGPVKWYTLDSGAARRRGRAVDNWWHKASTNTERKIYRLVDTKTGEIVR